MYAPGGRSLTRPHAIVNAARSVHRVGTPACCPCRVRRSSPSSARSRRTPGGAARTAARRDTHRRTSASVNGPPPGWRSGGRRRGRNGRRTDVRRSARALRPLRDSRAGRDRALVDFDVVACRPAQHPVTPLAFGQPEIGMPAERDRDSGAPGGFDLRCDAQPARGEPRVDRDDVRKRKRGRTGRDRRRSRTVARSRPSCSCAISNGAHQQIPVDRKPVRVDGRSRPRRSTRFPAAAVAPVTEPVAPRMHERDRGDVTASGLRERTRPRHVLFAAVLQRQCTTSRTRARTSLRYSSARSVTADLALPNRQVDGAHLWFGLSPLLARGLFHLLQPLEDRHRLLADLVEPGRELARPSSGRPCASRAPRPAGSTPRRGPPFTVYT